MRLLVRPEAEEDLALARDWYDRKRSGLGDDFPNEIGLVMSELEHNAPQIRLYYRNFRRSLLRRFPYKIFYQVFGEHIIIFRVLHAREDHQRNLPDVFKY